MTQDNNGHRPALTPDYFKFSPPDYHVDPLFPLDLVMFVGDPDSGKSLTTLYLAACTAGGKDFLSFSTRSGPVVMVNNEHGKESGHDRLLRKMCLGLGLDSAKLPIYSYHDHYLDLTSKKVVDDLMNVCLASEAVMVVIDNLGSSIGSKQENPPNTQQVITHLRTFVSHEITPILIHHYSKQRDPSGNRVTRGAGNIDAGVDRKYGFQKLSTRPRQARTSEGIPVFDPDGSPSIEDVIQEFGMQGVTGGKSRASRFQDIRIWVDEDDETGAIKLVNRGKLVESDPNYEIKNCILSLLQVAKKGLGIDETYNGLGQAADRKDLRLIFKELIESGEVEYRQEGAKFRYFLPGTQQESGLGESVSKLCKEYIAKGRYVVTVKEIVDALTPEHPYLGDMKGRRSASATVRTEVTLAGYDIRNYGNGGVLTAFLHPAADGEHPA